MSTTLRHGILDYYRAPSGGGSWPTDGLLCHLPLDASLNDDSGNGNHCTAFNATELAQMTYSAGKIGNCINVPNRSQSGWLTPFDCTQAFTISWWFNVTLTARTVMCNVVGGGDLWWLLMCNYTGGTGKLRIEAHKGSWSNSTGTKVINDGNWHWVCITFDGTSAWNIYVDAESPATLTKAGDPSGKKVNMPVYQTFNGQTCYGAYDSFFFYNRVLSDAERLQLWNGGSGV